MLDLIFDTRVYDLGDTIWYSPLRIDFTNVFMQGDAAFASLIDRNGERYATTIERAIDAILDNN
jgi:hypothetical protein